jgi:hypothetical protein
MAFRYPIEYEIEPTEINVGTNWLTIRLKNIGSKDLSGLDVRLNSFDTYNLMALDAGCHTSIHRSAELGH